MDIESIRQYCLSKKATTEGFPFDDNTLVFKVAGKIYLATNLNAVPLRITLKCDPEKAIDLRERYESIIPGYHSNKKHWNTMILNGEVSKDIVIKLIDHSYKMVVVKLSKKVRKENLLVMDEI